MVITSSVVHLDPPPSNPFAWHAGHIVIWPCASGVTIAELGQLVEAYLLHRVTLIYSCHVNLFAKINALGLVQWPPGNGERVTC